MIDRNAGEERALQPYDIAYARRHPPLCDGSTAACV